MTSSESFLERNRNDIVEGTVVPFPQRYSSSCLLPKSKRMYDNAFFHTREVERAWNECYRSNVRQTSIARARRDLSRFAREFSFVTRKTMMATTCHGTYLFFAVTNFHVHNLFVMIRDCLRVSRHVMMWFWFLLAKG